MYKGALQNSLRICGLIKEKMREREKREIDAARTHWEDSCFGLWLSNLHPQSTKAWAETLSQWTRSRINVKMWNHQTLTIWKGGLGLIHAFKEMGTHWLDLL